MAWHSKQRYYDNRNFERNKGKRGYVYILENRPNDFVYKIGHTTRRNVDVRAREINSKNGGFYAYKPANFFCIHKKETIDCYTAEQMVHKKLDSFRVMRGFELFAFKNNEELTFAKAVIHRICMQINGEFSEPIIITPPPREYPSQEPFVRKETFNRQSPIVKPEPPAPPKPSRISIAWSKFQDFMGVVVWTIVYIFYAGLACVALWSFINSKFDTKKTPNYSTQPIAQQPLKPIIVTPIIKNKEKMLRDNKEKEIKQSHKKPIKTKKDVKKGLVKKPIAPVGKQSEFEVLKMKTQQSIKNRTTTETPIEVYKEKLKKDIDDTTQIKEKYCFNLT